MMGYKSWLSNQSFSPRLHGDHTCHGYGREEDVVSLAREELLSEGQGQVPRKSRSTLNTTPPPGEERGEKETGKRKEKVIRREYRKGSMGETEKREEGEREGGREGGGRTERGREERRRGGNGDDREKGKGGREGGSQREGRKEEER